MSISDKELQKLVKQKDPRVIFGEAFRKESVLLVLFRRDADEDFKETGKAVCTNCFQLLAATDGSHVTRHVTERCKKRKIDNVECTDEDNSRFKQKKITQFNEKRLSTNQVAGITDATAKFCLRSGKSFNFCSSNHVQQFTLEVVNSVLPGFTADTLKQLPGRTTVQKYTEKHATELIIKAFQTVSKYAGTRLNLVLDHGKLINNYLSFFGSFIDEDFSLQLVPLGFTPALDGKTNTETVKLIVKRFEEFGIDEDKVMSSRVTADGALAGLGAHFRKYIRCVNHSLNLVAQRTVKLLDVHKSHFNEEEIKVLKHVDGLMEDAQKVSNAIRTNVNLCASLSKLPPLSVETRWLIGLKCLSGVLDLSDEIQSNFSSLSKIGKESFNRLSVESFKAAKTVVKFFEDIVNYNDIFQSQKAVTLHLVLPAYKRLRNRWENYSKLDFDSFDDDVMDIGVVEVLAKAALLSLSHYYAQFDDIHFAAVMLSPRTKKMTMFSSEDVTRAKKCIRGLLPRDPTPPKEVKKTEKTDIIESLYQSVSDTPEDHNEIDELNLYLGEFTVLSETVEDYWRKKRNEFPTLYEVAAQVFSHCRIPTGQKKNTTSLRKSGTCSARSTNRFEVSKLD
ncbi:unnamed protein product [Caenorhabditis sp. 36 PRJEB53466]|nr:unnamed protein product [Caenorhabditis sp. 36 PRJEB53466]